MSTPEELEKGSSKISNLYQEAHDLLESLWSEHIFLTWRWWLNIGFTFIPWLIWLKYSKRESRDRLLYAGLTIIIISMLLDSIGIQYGRWYYMYEVVHFIPCFIPFDTSLLPVTVMLFIQYKPEVNPLIKAVIFAGITSFIAEPIFVWLDLVRYPNWEYVYSFGIYILLYLIAHFVATRNRFNPIK